MLDSGDYEGTYEADAGHLALDFANTVSWHASERAHEWLNSYQDLVTWGEITGILPVDQSWKLRSLAGSTPDIAGQIMERTIALREAIYHIFSSVAHGRHTDPDDLEILNQELHISSSKRYIDITNDHFTWKWSNDPLLLERIIWPVAQAAADLLVSEEIHRVGECEGEGCGWMFLDLSKNQSRRWCSMNECGNRAKARRYYRKQKKTGEIIPASS